MNSLHKRSISNYDNSINNKSINMSVNNRLSPNKLKPTYQTLITKIDNMRKTYPEMQIKNNVNNRLIKVQKSSSPLSKPVPNTKADNNSKPIQGKINKFNNLSQSLKDHLNSTKNKITSSRIVKTSEMYLRNKSPTTDLKLNKTSRETTPKSTSVRSNNYSLNKSPLNNRNKNQSLDMSNYSKNKYSFDKSYSSYSQRSNDSKSPTIKVKRVIEKPSLVKIHTLNKKNKIFVNTKSISKSKSPEKKINVTKFTNFTNFTNTSLLRKFEANKVNKNNTPQQNTSLNKKEIAKIEINTSGAMKKQKDHNENNKFTNLIKAVEYSNSDYSSADVLSISKEVKTTASENLDNSQNLNNRNKQTTNNSLTKRLIEIINPITPITNSTSSSRRIKSYHCLSKIGYSGAGVKKVNQDNYFFYTNFNDNKDSIYVSVCDGHGVYGHDVSLYLKENLATNLDKEFKNKKINLAHQDSKFINQFPKIKKTVEDVFLSTNIKLNQTKIDTHFSGSTCVSVICTNNKLICANVGDSRAIVGRLKNGKWSAHDLSRDHKPNEKDEAQRIIKRGGRIEPYRDEDDEFAGPERVWLKEDDIPGLAMTRSFGDKIAASVGVIAEPEISEFSLTSEDKFLLLASDGVWEFITSDECVNMVSNYWKGNDVENACDFLHKESSRRWLNVSNKVIYFRKKK